MSLLQAAVGCRTAQVIMQYCILANHYWFVVEAVYLYKLLIGAVFSEKNNYTLYLYLGWGKWIIPMTRNDWGKLCLPIKLAISGKFMKLFIDSGRQSAI